MRCAFNAVHEAWPIAGDFRIARGSKRWADVVVVTVAQDGAVGAGECVPYARYGESVRGCIDELRKFLGRRRRLPTREELIASMPAGAARNALDCALVDLEAALTGRPAWEVLELPEPVQVQTALTLSLDTPEAMARAVERPWPLLKCKLGGDDVGADAARLRAVREAAPEARLIVDANESWSVSYLEAMFGPLTEVDVALLEQPLPEDADDALVALDAPLPIGADESVHDGLALEALAEKYTVLNLKLDKTGGVTRALAVREAVRDAGLGVMVGCMVATSLSMLPALLVAQGARFVDLDGGLLLRGDRVRGVEYGTGTAAWPQKSCWGGDLGR